MCRSTDIHGFHGNDSLRITSFFIRLANLKYKKLPESLTLVYLPRINEQTELEVCGKKIRPDCSAFVTLYRLMTAEMTEENESVYGSREKVAVSDGVMFDVYLGGEKVLKGVFRKCEGDEWKVECKSALEREMAKKSGADVARADICVGCEGRVAMVDRVEVMVRKKRSRCCRLEEIPEQREVVVEDEDVSDGCCCSCGGEMESECESDGEDLAVLDLQTQMDGVRWAVDLGFWAVCLGVGFFVSKASAKALRRKRIF